MAAPRNANIRGKILDGAAKLLESSSFAEVTLTDIARAVGVSKGTLYYYYNSKNEILFDIADQYLSLLADSLLAWTEDKSKDTSLHRLLHYMFTRGIFDESGNLRLYLIGSAVSGNEELRQQLMQKYIGFKNTIADKIRRRRLGADAEYLAWLVLILMDGLLVQNQLQNPQLDIRSFIEKTVGVLEHL